MQISSSKLQCDGLGFGPGDPTYLDSTKQVQMITASSFLRSSITCCIFGLSSKINRVGFDPRNPTLFKPYYKSENGYSFQFIGTLVHFPPLPSFLEPIFNLSKYATVATI